MWITLFLAFAWFVAMFRIIIFAFSSGSFDDKLGRAKNWLIGLILLSISWFILGKIFGIGTSMQFGSSATEVSGDAFQNNNNNNNNNNNSVPINLD